MSLPKSASRRVLAHIMPQRMQVTFAADGVYLARIDLFGRTSSHIEKLPMLEQASEAPAWQAWVLPLTSWLQEHAEASFELSVFLSDRFVRYQHLPWHDGINGERERQALASHRFRQVYGEVAGQWELALTDDMPGNASMVCAIDHALLEALRGIGTNAHLISVQPLFVAAYNRALQKCKGHQFWFVHVEPGRVCMALLKSGQSKAVRNEASNELWPQAIAAINRRIQPDFYDEREQGAVPIYISGDLQGVTPPLSLAGHPVFVVEAAA